MPSLYLPALHPIDGETFGSFVWRLAQAAHTTPRQMLHRVGATVSSKRTQPVVLLQSAHLLLHHDQIQAVARTLQIPESIIQATLITRYEDALFTGPFSVVNLKNLQIAMAGTWLKLHDPWYCPSCLAEEGAWKVAWHTPWTPVCTRHHTLLRQSCPTCLAPTAGGAITPRSRNVAERVPDVTHCANQFDEQRLCNGPLTLIGASGAVSDHGPLMHAQRVVETLLSGQSAAFLGNQQTRLEFFRRLRRYTQMLLLTAQVADLGPLPEEVALEFGLVARERDVTLDRRFHRNSWRIPAVVRMTLQEQRPSPSLVAAVLPLALRMAVEPAEQARLETLSLMLRSSPLIALPDAEKSWGSWLML